LGKTKLSDSLIGQQLDEYRLEALLGQGGMARVYRALDVRLKRWVAIKVMAAPYRADSDYTRRFEREAQAIAQLEHPHIVRLYRSGEAKGLLYMAMQYIEGAPLNEVLASYREEGEFIESAEASRIVREVCLALDYAHRKGVIHRDVKPANIVLNKQGQAILTDFGLALLTDDGTRGDIFGTPHYMAPEQAMSSASAKPQSDLYAVGVILYEMFTGVLPFDAPQPLDVVMLHMTKPPRSPRQIRPELSRKLEAVILKSLAKEPKDRYPTGRALATALDKALEVAPAKPPAAVARHTISERVALSLAKRPLPPLPAAVASPAASPARPKSPPRPARRAKAGKAGRKAVRSSSAARRRRPIYLSVGLGLAVSLGLILALLGWLRFNGWPGGLEEAADQFAPPVLTAEPTPTPSQTPTPVLPTATSIPSLTPTPPSTEASAAKLPPSSTPTPAPLPLADSQAEFSGTQGQSNWQYQWSRGRESFNWVEMQFDGSCWRAPQAEGHVWEDYVRICPNSAHPGIEGDITWRWTSEVSGPIQVEVSARKLDIRGGDGVQIIVYRNTEEIRRWPLEATNSQGFTQPFSLNIAQGDYLFFVLKAGGDATNDETAFQVQIY
jgi:serine/threonine protein kinase